MTDTTDGPAALSRRGALGAIGTGAVGTAGCLEGGEQQGPPAGNSPTAPPAQTDVPEGSFTTDEQSGVRYVESAAGMNAALRDLPESGGIVRWLPGSYTGEDFTEMVTIPDLERKGNSLTLDMRSVHIDVEPGAPYRGEDGAFFYKPATDGSVKVNILGPHMLRITGDFGDVNPREGAIYAEEGEDNDPFTEEDPSPHVFYLYNTESCRIAPAVAATRADRILYFRQNGDCGHHVFTNGFRSWGGNVALQVSDGRDNCGKDRCQWYGQLGGYAEAGVFLAGKAKTNRVWAQIEGPRGDAGEHVTGYKIRNQMNSLMLTHIAAEDSGHAFDIQARNCGIFAPCTDGNPQPFKHARLGVRPSNVYKPNYTASAYDMAMDYRPNLSLIEEGDGRVGYDGREKELTLAASSGRAGIQTPGCVGRMGHHFHGYVDARIRGETAGNANAEFRFGAWADEDNHALLTYDPRRENPLGATVRTGGERVDDPGNVVAENATVSGTAGPASWIAYVRADYQALFKNYSLVYEAEHDLTGWPRDPHLRVDNRDLGSENTSGRIRRIEYGDARKAEGAEEFISQLGRDIDSTIDRPWRREDISVG